MQYKCCIQFLFWERKVGHLSPISARYLRLKDYVQILEIILKFFLQKLFLYNNGNNVYITNFSCVLLNIICINGFIYKKHSCTTQVLKLCLHNNLVTCKDVNSKENRGEIGRYLYDALRIKNVPEFAKVDDE